MRRVLTNAVVPTSRAARAASTLAVSATLAAAALTVATTLASAPAAFAQAPQPTPEPKRIADTVAAGGVDLSGLTAAEAAAKLRAELAPRLDKPVVVRIAGRRFEFDAKNAKVKLNADKTV